MLSQFFLLDHDPSLIINGVYNPSLVILSVITVIFAAYFSLFLIDLANKTRFKTYRRLASTTGSLVLSGGIWSMHFIGMLAFSLCTNIEYNPLITFISFFPAFFACLVAFSYLRKTAQPTPKFFNLLISAVLLGSGIGTMHYSGMAAMELSPLLRYDPLLFAASIVVAVALAFIGLFARFNLPTYFKSLNEWQCRVVSAIILGFAVSGMHYMGMAATRFVATGPLLDDNISTSHLVFIAASVSFATVLLTAVVAIINGMVRYRMLLAEKTADESRLEAILATAIDGIVTIDEHGNILSFNRSAEQIFGWQQHEVLNKNVKILMANEIARQHDNYLENATHHTVKRVIGINRDVCAKHKDGHLFPIRLGIGEVKLPDGDIFVGFITDLTEQRKLQESLFEKEQQYRTLMDNMPGVVFRCLLDEHWTMRFISPSVLDLTGYSHEDFIKNQINFAQLIDQQDQDAIEDAINRALKNGQKYAIEYRIRHRNGKTIWVLDQGSINSKAGSDEKWIDGVLVDITERHDYEQTLKDAKLEAEAAAHAKQSFMANMSHEIRTPMNSIIGFSDILMDSPLNKEQQKHIATVNTAARSLLHLLNDVLDSAKLEKGKLEINIAHFNIHTLLDNIISTFWLEAKRKDLLINLDITDDVSAIYQGDESRIRQVLNNLIGNAIKFTEHGAITIKLSKTQNQQLFFEVEDTGIGIAQNRLRAIFQPFVQADGTTTRRFGGTGLGTTISKQLVELMGGTINAVSTEGKGSCFFFSLPLEEGDIEHVENPTNSLITLPPLRVLVADDIEQNIELLTILLSQSGHSVMAAENGHQAVELFKQHSFDVILMDVHMPECDGIEACHIIRELEQQKQLKNTPIIALTASVLQQDKITAKQAGMNGFANKPVDIYQLNHEIARVLGLSIKQPKALSQEATKQHINYVKGMKMWGSKEKLCQQISDFLAKHQHSLDSLTLKNADTSHDEILHTLKGVAGNLALGNLTQLLTNAEKQIRTDTYSKAIAACRQEWQFLTHEMTEQLVSFEQAERNEERHHVSNEQFLEHITKLKLQAEQAEIDDEFLVMVQATAPAQLAATINSICLNFEEFEFDAALQSLNELQTQLTEGL